MTTETLVNAQPTVAPSRAILPTGFGRLLLVEARKLVNTRAGRWLLVIAVLASIGAAALSVAYFPERTVSAVFFFSFLPLGLLVPVVAILTATAEWSQRTGLTTFALEPRRGRVVAAKLVVSLLAGVAIMLVSGVFTYAAAGIGALAGQSWDGWALDLGVLAGPALNLMLLMLQASAFGLILLNTPSAVVLYFVLPQVWTTVVGFVPWLASRAAWLDLNAATEPMFTSLPDMTGQHWLQLACATALWVLVPLAAGVWRFLRAEVK
ncbi:hypothetical protein GCM10025789_03000 [Tessaracoccus lubricantis]|uniref:ABC transporter permease n=1 Tax=Tessaracoccus lubricantis TaxID=545543 RepID=A0ABP9F7F2_9ACTN